MRKLHRRCHRRLLGAVAYGKSFLSGTRAGRAKIPFASPAVNILADDVLDEAIDVVYDEPNAKAATAA